MTVIVAVTDGKQVVMGADSFLGNNGSAFKRASPKLFSKEILNGDVHRCTALFGVSGDFRGEALLRNMSLPSWPTSVDLSEYVGIHLVDAVRTKFREGGYIWKESEKESQDLHFLVGIQGRIFSIWTSFDTIESEEYMAVGAGMYLALGALNATRGLEPKERVRIALEAAAEHHPFVRPPFHIQNDS